MSDEQVLAVPETTEVRPTMSTKGGLQHLTKVAKILSQSHLAPAMYRENPSNAIIAVQQAFRLGCDPLTVMQNLYVINSKPSWSAQFLISVWNSCGRFSPIRFEWRPDRTGCRASSTERETGEKLRSTEVTMEMAKAEGWINKSGSKWRTMPEQMLMYRAATFLVRAFAPEISLGLMTSEEQVDIAAPLADVTILDGSVLEMETVPDVDVKDSIGQGRPDPQGSADSVASAGEQGAPPAAATVEPTKAKTADAEPPAGEVSTETVAVEMVTQLQTAEMLRLCREQNLPQAAYRSALKKLGVSSAKELTKAKADRLIGWLEKQATKKSSETEMTEWAEKALPDAADDVPF